MKSCFGAIYPDLSSRPLNGIFTGKVFKIRTESLGLMRQRPHVECDMAAWEECQGCEQFRSCYDFSNARLAIQHTARGMV
jgi:hypothetical protein